jgi:hypothetical protein
LFLRVHVLKGRRRQIDALHSTKMRDSGNFFFNNFFLCFLNRFKYINIKNIILIYLKNKNLIGPEEDRRCGFFNKV